MPTYAYITQPLDDRDGEFEASRGAILQLADELGLHVDREFVEAPGDAYVDWKKKDWRCAPLADRPVAQEVLAALQPGDALLVDNLMLELRQLAALISELAERGVELHVPTFELRGFPSGPPMAKLLLCYLSLERHFASRRTQDDMLLAKLEGRPCGRLAPGWKHVGPPERRRRVPNKEERAVMMEIVKLRISGWGFRKIASLLARERVMYRVPDRKRRLGYRLEFWSAGRCERGYNNMMQILAEERVKQKGSSLASST